MKINQKFEEQVERATEEKDNLLKVVKQLERIKNCISIRANSAAENDVKGLENEIKKLKTGTEFIEFTSMAEDTTAEERTTRALGQMLEAFLCQDYQSKESKLGKMKAESTTLPDSSTQNTEYQITSILNTLNEIGKTIKVFKKVRHTV